MTVIKINSKKPFGLWYYHVLDCLNYRKQALIKAAYHRRKGNKHKLNFWQKEVKRWTLLAKKHNKNY